MTNLRALLFKTDEPTSIKPEQEAPASDPKSTRAKETTRLSLSNIPILRNARSEDARIDSSDKVRQRLKSRIHARLVENIDIQALMLLDESEQLELAIERTLHLLIDEEKLPLTSEERHRLVREVLHETLGLGPLEPLLSDPQINDILVNGSQNVWIDRDGLLEETDIRFKDDNHLVHIINRIVSRVGRRVDESSPIVDARLPDGSRVNAIIPPLALNGEHCRFADSDRFRSHKMISSTKALSAKRCLNSLPCLSRHD